MTSIGQTVGLLQHDQESLDDGYVLFAPMGSNNTYLIDKCGKLAKTWGSAYRPGISVYLMPDGRLLRPGIIDNATFNAGGRGGIIEIIDWDGTVSWSYTLSSNMICQHHDVRALPNGNILAIVWESKTQDEAVAQGRDPALVSDLLWSEAILEIQPTGATTGEVVWEWHLWDHLVQTFDATKPNFGEVADHAELVDLNFNASAVQSDWIHLNSVDYNPDLDQVLVSAHAFDEIWIIDHSTNTAEAAEHTGGNAGHGGDLLYRWGNPATYGHGSASDQVLYGQHNARWIENGLPYAGDIMLFNNGSGRPDGNYSTVEVIKPPMDEMGYSSLLPYGPTAPVWLWNDGNPHSLFAQNISGAQQLSNGNVLVTNGPIGNFIEVDALGPRVWSYVNPVAGNAVLAQNAEPVMNAVFRSSFYPSSYTGFTNHVLVAEHTIEDINPVSDACALTTAIGEAQRDGDPSIFPNPASDRITINFDPALMGLARIQVFNSLGQCVITTTVPALGTQLSLPVGQLENGLYVVKIEGQGTHAERTLCVLH
ncbi:MAG: aryl-sulfate sulfotransferase [Flavobacteriales bacterium]|nr:aryl-sulfate sulfotransferase [Flavobacteriales bacterium]MCI1752913.1 aryl-sulfate sulfotransferase [Flavobacteriales bacterium]